MENTKSKILNIIIIAVLSIPLDKDIAQSVVGYIQTHPAIDRVLHLLKKSSPDNNARRSDDEKTKATENIGVSTHSESIPSAVNDTRLINR